MKLSVSVPDEDVAFLDRYGAARRIESRSAVVQRAIRLLRASELDADYERAWADWADSGDADLWNASAGDGVG